MVTFVIHIIFLTISTSLLNYFSHSKISQTLLAQTDLIEKNKELFGTFESPLNGNQHYRIESVSEDYWNSTLFFGKPSFESDRAWENLISPRALRLSHDEAARLNITDSMLVQPGEDFGVEMGLIHHLHCLRSMRQAMDADYYYPGASGEEMNMHQQHTRHCLEVLRTALLCNPDLNLYPYTRGRENQPVIGISAKVTRKCTNWAALQKVLAPREVKGNNVLMLDTGPFSY